MQKDIRSRILEVRGPESVELFKALGSETRVKMLELLAQHPMNIHEVAEELEISQPTVTKHMQILEHVGLATSEYSPGAQGMQKKCSLGYDRLVISFENLRVPDHKIEEIQMPIGLYTLISASPTCGLATSERFIGILDDPQSFFHPSRGMAQLIWMADGFVEYSFPNSLPTSAEIERIELAAEICSEAPHYNPDYPSDITVWINGVDIGTWTSPGDFGGKPGRLNPQWWDPNWTQFGMIKVWSVDKFGSYVDGLPVSSVNTNDLQLAPQQSISVRIGVKPDAEHAGGFNIFGRGFGNYEQDIALRFHYDSRTPDMKKNGRAAAAEESLAEEAVA